MTTTPTDRKTKLDSEQILGVSLDTLSYRQVVGRVLDWSRACEIRYVCTANVHMVMLAQDDAAFKAVLEGADIITADGMHLVWLLRRRGHAHQERVYGPTLMGKLLAHAAVVGIPVGFLGSSPRVIDQLQTRVRRKYPQIDIAYAYSPPYREFEPDENAEMIAAINQSGARILFVGLGCPKQEVWMFENKGQIQAVMLGVGAAFDFIAGEKRQAPAWIQRMGMEWFFRLISEPKRLWRRYFYNNPRFLFALAREWVNEQLGIKPGRN